MVLSVPFIQQTDVTLSPDATRVVLRKFMPSPESRVASIIGRINTLSEKEVLSSIKDCLSRFSKRHEQIEETLFGHYASLKSYFDTDFDVSPARQLLIGAYFTNEYSFESAALFNPSIVIHPDQTGIPTGSVRFIMSLRATGEGHISSLTFRTGYIDASYMITLDPVSNYSVVAPPVIDAPYDKVCFRHKLAEMGYDNDFSSSVFALLQDSFTYEELNEALSKFIRHNHLYSEQDYLFHDKIICLARANYTCAVSEQFPLSSWVIFPGSPTEKQGIEDVRFVRFTDDDGSLHYYATYILHMMVK